MRERPIIFSAPMVRALLAGSKTQTRRLMRFDDDGPRTGPFADWPSIKGVALNPDFERPSMQRELARFCPYGAHGDRLWVRETWQAWSRVSTECDEWEPLTPEARNGIAWGEWVEQNGKPDSIEYRATSESVGPWTPSIFMPPWASRITLQVMGVRVERLQSITEADAKAEGVRPFFTEFSGIGRDQRITSGELASSAEHRAAYAVGWDTINEHRATWKSNPWVWVIEFKCCLPELRAA